MAAHITTQNEAAANKEDNMEPQTAQLADREPNSNANNTQLVQAGRQIIQPANREPNNTASSIPRAWQSHQQGGTNNTRQGMDTFVTGNNQSTTQAHRYTNALTNSRIDTYSKTQNYYKETDAILMRQLCLIPSPLCLERLYLESLLSTPRCIRRKQSTSRL
jgi:hypothetical protein